MPVRQTVVALIATVILVGMPASVFAQNTTTPIERVMEYTEDDRHAGSGEGEAGANSDECFRRDTCG